MSYKTAAPNFACVLECGGAPPLLDRRRSRERKDTRVFPKAAEHRRTPQRGRHSEALEEHGALFWRRDDLNNGQISLPRYFIPGRSGGGSSSCFPSPGFGQSG